MIKEVKGEKTLLVNGPASVRLVSGGADILGALLSVGERVVVRGGKRTPFHVGKEASFDVTHAKDSIVEEADGDTVPLSWHKAAEEILGLEKPTVVMIMGEVDSGKTSLCTFLVNRAFAAGRTVAVIDADLGQSDIGPPTTVGLAYVNKPVKDLFHVEADDACFVGSTSPGGAEERVVNCIVDFKNQALGRYRGFLAINTDGWVEGEEAFQYKVTLTESVSPNMVVGIQREKELAPILDKIKKPVITVEPSIAVKERDRERRKALRELSYKKHLKNAKVETFPLNWVRIEGIHSSPSLFITRERLKKIEETLGTQPIFCEETVEALWVVLRRSQRLDLETLRRAREVFNKEVRVALKGDEKDLIVGLQDKENKFLGLGVISRIDYRRKAIRVATPVTREVSSIRVGNVKLDDAYREIGMATLWT